MLVFAWICSVIVALGKINQLRILNYFPRKLSHGQQIFIIEHCTLLIPRDGNTFSDGSYGFEYPLRLVPVEQGYDCQFLVWDTVQGNVSTLGPVWF